MLFTERPGIRPSVYASLRQTVADHYVSPTVAADRLSDLGAPITAALLREQQPNSKRARSGDVGEILATELVERRLGLRVPIRRLRYKDGREMALRGDDIVGVADLGNNQLRFLKGESKSRAQLTDTVIAEAAEGLDKDDGRPSRHSVLFVSSRLREFGSDPDKELAKRLELAVASGFRGHKVEHLLFSLCGNDPQTGLSNHLTAHRRRRTVRYAVAIRITDHQLFIRSLY